MKIRTRLQPHNRKFEGEFEIFGREFAEKVGQELGIDSLLISCCVTTFHHETHAKAKAATRKAIRALAEKLLEMSA